MPARRKAKIRKAFVTISMIFVILGVVLVVFSPQKPYTEESTIGEWNVSTPYSTLIPLTPYNLTGWAPIEEGSYFELNVSASNVVRVRIGASKVYSDTREEIWTDLVFDQFGTQFTQNVTINERSLVEIKNDGTSPVNISGNILLRETSVRYQAVYPYPGLGTLLLLVGSTLLVYGVMTSPKKSHFTRRARSRQCLHGLRPGFTDDAVLRSALALLEPWMKR